jgi:gliding motility-associated protein GldC
MMQQENTITIQVALDENKMPEKILWNATGSTAETAQMAKGAMLSLWDGSDKSALRIDLWTKDMMIDEMTDFYYQTLMGMADTYLRATNNEEMCNDLKTFAKTFYQKFRQQQLEQNK